MGLLSWLRGHKYQHVCWIHGQIDPIVNPNGSRSALGNRFPLIAAQHYFNADFLHPGVCERCLNEVAQRWRTYEASQ